MYVEKTLKVVSLSLGTDPNGKEVVNVGLQEEDPNPHMMGTHQTHQVPRADAPNLGDLVPATVGTKPLP